MDNRDLEMLREMASQHAESGTVESDELRKILAPALFGNRKQRRAIAATLRKKKKKPKN